MQQRLGTQLGAALRDLAQASEESDACAAMLQQAAAARGLPALQHEARVAAEQAQQAGRREHTVSGGTHTETGGGGGGGALARGHVAERLSAELLTVLMASLVGGGTAGGREVGAAVGGGPRAGGLAEDAAEGSRGAAEGGASTQTARSGGSRPRPGQGGLLREAPLLQRELAPGAKLKALQAAQARADGASERAQADVGEAGRAAAQRVDEAVV